MKKKLIILASVAVIAALMWFADFRYPQTYLQKAFYSFLALAISYALFKLTFEEIVSKRIKEPKTRYSFRKIASVLFILTFLVIAIAIWVEHPQATLVSYGVLAAGAAIALQDIFKNFVGGITIFASGIYRVGDRIEVSSKIGDVIDIGILYTTLLEINNWVPGDQATGRLSTIPNSGVLSGIVNNYTRDHGYIWDEITIPITYDSDWKEGIDLIMGAVGKATKETAEKAEMSISRPGEKYYLTREAMEPTIFLTLTDNWINFNIRYVTEVRERRTLRNALSQTLLDGIQKSANVKLPTGMNGSITGLLKSTLGKGEQP